MLACAEAMFLIRHPQPFKTSESITGELGRSIWLLWCWPKNVACCCWPIIAPLFYFIIIFLTKVHGNVLALRQKLPQWTETDFLSPILVSFFTKKSIFFFFRFGNIEVLLSNGIHMIVSNGTQSRKTGDWNNGDIMLVHSYSLSSGMWLLQPSSWMERNGDLLQHRKLNESTLSVCTEAKLLLQ